MSKVLIAEDDPLMMQLVSFKLKQNGVNVITARDGESALALAQNEKPDLIVLDCMMPVMDGFEVLRRLKESDELRRIPVVMLTARNKDVDVVTGLELGASDYIPKPFSPNEFIARVKRLLSN
ncbi:MAG: response regulator [Verrucomicrobia bacterium]|nr:response regulator [Verrucomicrobiota bacterium]MCF7707614.1 response regulator [Verrucomicrobiota bacterium]